MRKLIPCLLDRLPYIRTLREHVRNAGYYPPAHFHSPLPAREEVLARLRFLEARKGSIPDVDLNRDQQLARLKVFETFYGELPFPESQTEGMRYYFNQTVFGYADAIFLYCLLRQIKPKRIIEVGSGFSSAVMLDTVDRFLCRAPKMTFIEPSPGRLRQLLTPQDHDRVTVIEDKVQNVPLDEFRTLGSGDLLFIDSSHVLKCGSDLQFLMFDVLPLLPTGVLVHFHDVFDSFEYPSNWLLDGWYWNEAYALRCFLAYNSTWEIYFFGNHMVREFAKFFEEKMPLCVRDPGGSLYIRRIR
jgi:hypothetical protein